MYSRPFLLLSLVTVPLFASEKQFFILQPKKLSPGKHTVLITMGTYQNGEFIPSKDIKLKIDRDEKLTEMNTWLNEKKGKGDLCIKNNHILFDTYPGAQVIEMSEVPEAVKKISYQSIANSWPDETLATISTKLALPEVQDMKFRFILTAPQTTDEVDVLVAKTATLSLQTKTNQHGSSTDTPANNINS